MVCIRHPFFVTAFAFCMSAASPVHGNPESCERREVSTSLSHDLALEQDENEEEGEGDDLNSLLQMNANCFTKAKEEEGDDLESLLQVHESPQLLPRSHRQKQRTQVAASGESNLSKVETLVKLDTARVVTEAQAAPGNASQNDISAANLTDEASPSSNVSSEVEQQRVGDKALPGAMDAALDMVNGTMDAALDMVNAAETVGINAVDRASTALNQSFEELLRETGDPVIRDSRAKKMERIRDMVAWFTLSVLGAVILSALIVAVRDRHNGVETQKLRRNLALTAHCNDAS